MTNSALPEVTSSSTLVAQPAASRLAKLFGQLKRFRWAIVAIASISAILSGLVGYWTVFGEESFQNGADVVRLTHLKYYSDLLAEYHSKTGIYPLQDMAAEAPVYVFVANDWQRTKGTPPYKHAVVSMRDWINELEKGLGRPVDEYYDPQYGAESSRPNLYIYMVYEDTFFFAVHLYHDYPFAKKVAEHYNKLEISNKPNAQNRVADPGRLFASEDYQSALKVPYKAGFFREREEKYLHFTKQQK